MSTPNGWDRATRRRLAAALDAAQPWLADPDLGPRAVEAGTCDRCDHQPRVVSTCGPVAWRMLCRDCLLEVGREAFCPGHAADGARLLSAAADLPETWATLVRLAWVASGEVRADTDFLADITEVLGDARRG